ncbi:metal-dependent hydrolase [Mycolicibacterium flavescens]|uniref:Metal-dependent hydrolase n=1 Tax=Mycolicibacterium flavescens TaxID=1776 RepID=A0A1E3REG5_MYCFV|nr:metal-dependent hydrolase [Mycolicibacterium flavescens]MCV7282646.1 metal-dependent hydrolase [Mycolicibacterium flavescens]ODQ88234.1 hypothetical protein BHQ18_20545 [Mycolicibacterium flavescens]
MTDLVIRKIGWDFDATVPFMWQPQNPDFGLFCNAFTFIAVPFERYIVGAVRRAGDQFTGEVAEEADAFLKQEAQHAAAHRKHMLALIARYPELEQCYAESCAAYDALLESESVQFHLAYIANLEATFTPLFKVILDNRDSLFDGGDARVASLMVWHFVEEIEHRSSGLVLSRNVSPGRWYRVKHIRHTFSHVAGIAKDIAVAFDRIVPFEDRGASTVDLLSGDFLSGELKNRLPIRRGARTPSIFATVPTRELARMLWRLALSQTPYHDPADQPLPQWAETWMRAYDRGTDMTRFVGAQPTGER